MNRRDRRKTDSSLEFDSRSSHDPVVGVYQVEFLSLKQRSRLRDHLGVQMINPEKKVGLEEPAILNSSYADPVNRFLGGSTGEAAGENVYRNPLVRESS